MSNIIEKRILLSPAHMSGKEISYIDRAFKDNWIVPLGPNVIDFENSMAAYLQKGTYAVAMSSGTAAIHIALRLLNVEPGEEVFCSSATFIATANPILYEKAVPVFIDSEPDTWNMCPQSLMHAIEEKKKSGKVPRVLICADLFGISAKYEEILSICEQNGIQVIEDSAESLGSSYKNQKCGTFGKFGVLSFNGNKIITTSGGGMLITHSKAEADKALFLITQARDKAPYYLHSEAGYNYRLSNICAGIGLGQLEVLDERVAARRRIFSFYSEHLKDTPLSFLKNPPDFFSNHWLSTALISEKSKYTPHDLITHLDKNNIEARHIWKPLHTQPIFAHNQFYKVTPTAVAEKIFNRGICLPSGSAMTDDQLNYIANSIKTFFG